MMPFDIEMDNDFVELQPDQQLKVDTITLNTDSGNIVIVINYNNEQESHSLLTVR